MRGWLERRFRLSEHGSDVRTELLGGTTTFATMAYIAVVNPAILAFAGVPVGPATTATILVAVVGSLLMGFYANRPVAVAPYMGENAFVAFGLTALGVSWPQALGAVFLSGLLFVAITLLGVRRWLAESISPSLKHSFAVGIGLFMALIGMYEAGLVASAAEGMPWRALVGADGETLGAPPTPLRIGDLQRPEPLLALAGFVLIAVLLQRRVRGAILLGMAATAGAAMLLGLAEAPRALLAMPFSGDYSLAGLAFSLDLAGALRPPLLPVLLTLFLMGFLDTLGTLVGVGAAGGLLDEKGDLPQIERPMLVDAVSCTLAGLVGTTTSGAYIESAAGIREGARTGLAAVATGLLFALALPFAPLLEPLQRLQFAYAPALIAVSVLMLGSVRHIDFDDLTELVPAFATIAVMAFSYNIANGLTAGLLLHPLIKLLAGRGRELKPGGLVLGALCGAYYAFGVPH